MAGLQVKQTCLLRTGLFLIKINNRVALGCGLVKTQTIMIIADVFYAVKCDRCGKVYDGADYVYYNDMDSSLEYAKVDDWVEIGGKHYCPNCYVFDEDTEEVKKKHPRPKHVRSLERFINDFIGCYARIIESDDDYEVSFYEKSLSTWDEEYIRKMLGSNLLSLECEPNGLTLLSKCMIKIKK